MSLPPLAARFVGSTHGRADLTRFLEGYRESFDQALAEIRGPQADALDVVHLPPDPRPRHQPHRAVHYAITPRRSRRLPHRPQLGAGYRQLVDAVWSRSSPTASRCATLFGRPDDQKLVSSLTLFATVAAGLDPTPALTTLIAEANAVLDVAATQGLPRCAVTTSILAR